MKIGIAISYSRSIILSVRGRKPTEYIQDIQEDMTMAKKNIKITAEDMEKLAKLIDSCTAYFVTNSSGKITCGEWSEDIKTFEDIDEDPYIHAIWDAIEIHDDNSNTTLYLFPVGDDIAMAKCIPHTGFDILDFAGLGLNLNKTELITRALLMVDRELR